MKTLNSIKKYSAGLLLVATVACQSLDEDPQGFVSPC